MRDPFAGYDAWLESPYQNMIAESDAFYEWAEEEGFDMEDNDDIRAAEIAYQDYLEACYEDAALSAAEDRMERAIDDYYEREEWF